MTTEEMIKEMYSDMKEMKGKFDGLEERFDGLEGSVEVLKGKMEVVEDTIKVMQDDIKIMQDDIKGIHLTIEQSIRPDIQLLVEGYKIISSGVDKAMKVTQNEDIREYRLRLCEREIIDIRNTMVCK